MILAGLLYMLNRPTLFLWLPKCAGTSISKVCARWASSPQILIGRDSSAFDRSSDFVTFGHHSIPALVGANILTEQDIDTRFVVTFVRNPWGRAVSLFAYWSSHPTLKRFVLHPETRRPHFGWFIRCLREGIHPIGLYGHHENSQGNPQVEWLRDPHTQRWFPDFIGRVETINEDWGVLRKMIGCGRIGHRNPTRHAHYREYYTPRLRRIVAGIYAEDIDVFRYTF